jgi:hypothetical protein
MDCVMGEQWHDDCDQRPQGVCRHRFTEVLQAQQLCELCAAVIFLVDEDDSTKNWSEFYHEQFLRDQPELMVHIRRKTYSEGETTDKEDVEELKRQVVSFQNQLETLTGQITNLTAVVSSLIARGGKRLTGNSQNDAEQGNKRPRRNISEEECATFL